MNNFLRITYLIGLILAAVLAVLNVWYFFNPPTLYARFPTIVFVVPLTAAGLCLAIAAFLWCCKRPSPPRVPSSHSTATTRKMPALKTREYQRKWAFTSEEEYWR